MLLSSVILGLQETLQAALLVSVLLATSQQLSCKLSWVIYAIGGGLVLAFSYALNIAWISEWFDYAGQEIVNALLQVSVAVLIGICTWVLVRGWTPESREDGPYHSLLFMVFATAAVMLAITREGFEMLIFLVGFYQIKEVFDTVIIGSLIGLGIGISVGNLIFYGLTGLDGRWRMGAAVSLLALFAGNMLSQTALQLDQANWISSTSALWNTTDLLSEESLPGKLLHALIGYESTPSIVQVIAYAAGAMLVVATAVAAYRLPPPG